ncbi:enoyl-CoA hydratase/isomerase [Pseudomassariella vexata]|uniref:3-hydroxyisobutyryl-CoA hydrolase n=1 Tax=Pseudomassariella vexata TaxID=1141098 RepID=A0A1Y2EK80_9PEZI|nr:enoyl-CoA hydratase/isomerase [Pseudomassariella vexata]ORY71951.1 enoyl-CoA hydratase/isomerase [Pseudomassariella vexata]
MPLKAKILDPRVTSRAQMSTGDVKQKIRPSPEDEPEDVLFNNLYGLRTVELNRPQKLNSLNASMIRKIVPRLVEWEKSDMANVVVMKGVGDKAFCAGGDVMALALQNREGPEGQQKSADYFALEYKLNHYIATYKKPYVAFMDGITMGGGVGLSIHAPFRIATERTTFAMPETTIGFFPDVGASYFLPRLPGSIGKYLALTSERLTGANVFYTGIATHYLHSTSLTSLENRLAELRFRDYDSMEMRLKIIEMTIEEYATGLPPLDKEPIKLAGELRRAIDRCFSKTNVPEIMAALEREEGSTKQWAVKTLETLHKRSPTSVYVSCKQMDIAKNWSISETFQREYQIAAHFMRHPDFTEGVTSLLSKPQRTPQWTPATLEDITDPIAAEPFFQKSAMTEGLELLVERDYTNNYPYTYVGVPSEQEVQQLVSEGTRSRREIVDEFVQRKNGRQGIATIVQEILRRSTAVDENGHAQWVYENQGPTI